MTEYRGKVRLVFKDFPLAIHDKARPAHEAARCAGTFGKYWEYHDRLFAVQPEFTRDDLIRYAAELHIPADRFTQCLDSGRFRTKIDADVEEGRTLGVGGTPTFLINGQPLVGARPYEQFKSAIDRALQESQGN
jgi:protein-disulfide isomerase